MELQQETQRSPESEITVSRAAEANSGVATGWLAAEMRGAAASDPRAVRMLSRLAGNRAVTALLTRAPARQLARSVEQEGTPGHRPNLDVGDRGPGVGLLQRILGIEETGIFDDTTLKAVKDFQRAHFPCEEAKGGVGPATWRELDKVWWATGPPVGSPGARPNLDAGDRGPAVTLLQRILEIPQTGYFDDATLKAVKDFQRKRFPDEEPKGGVGPLTWKELDKVLLTPSKDEYADIEIYPVVQDILPPAPGGSPNGMSVKAPDGSYVLHANVGSSGNVAYYLAYSGRRKRVEFAVGPSQLTAFLKTCETPRISRFNLNMWEIAAGNYFGVSGNSSEWQRLSAQAVSRAMRGDFAGYWRAWKGAQIAAFKDPAWWVYVLGGAQAMSASEVDAAAMTARADADAAAAEAGAVEPKTVPKPAATAPPPGPAAVTVTGSAEELAAVKTHLSSLPDGNALVDFPPNQAMVNRIAEAQASGRALTEGETNFLKHELTEAKLVKEGMTQEQAHEAALKTHPPFKNYDPSVIKQYPDWFNSNWRKAWGIE